VQKVIDATREPDKPEFNRSPATGAEKRIVFYNHTGQVSGAERMLLLTMAQLPARTYRPLLLCPKEGPLRGEAEEAGVEWRQVRMLEARYSLNPFRIFRYLASVLTAVREIRRTIAALAPDLIHANSPRAGVVATLATAGTGVPVVWHVHDILPPHPVSAIVRWLAKASRSTHILACSHAAADSIRIAESRNPDRRTTVIHNGIETKRYAADPQRANQMRKSLGLKANDFAIGIVGQILPRKGHLGLLRAFAKASRALPDALLIVIGAPIFNRDHEYLAALELEANRLGLDRRVRFLGQRRDADCVMQALDLVVVNSVVEPFGLVLLEAMMMGKPVVATASGGPTEVIEHGVNGHIVPVNDDEALARAIISVATDAALRTGYGERGPARVLSHFTSGHYISSLVAFYSGMVDAEQKTNRSNLRMSDSNAARRAGLEVRP
jgi:glycosyltransferase involved in cell wall biosynthesis